MKGTETKRKLFFIVVLVVFITGTLFVVNSFVVNDCIVKCCTIGSCVFTFCGLFYAVYELEEHKSAVKTDLLCRYNKRFSADKNIEAVIKYILKAGITNEEGDIFDVDKEKCNDKEVGIFEKEMFMRFFEELQKQIEKNLLDKKEVFYMFSYYAIQFDKYESYHSDITDYYSSPWKSYREFVQIMKDEQKKDKL